MENHDALNIRQRSWQIRKMGKDLTFRLPIFKSFHKFFIT